MMVKIMMTSILCFVQISCTLVPDSFLSWIPTDQKMHQTSPFHIHIHHLGLGCHHDDLYQHNALHDDHNHNSNERGHIVSAQRVPEPDPLPGIFFDTRPDPIQF